MRSSAKAGAVVKDPGTTVVHYGSRKGPKLIRIYKKEELGIFRIEGEFHSPFLRKHRIDTEQDIGGIAHDFYPAHVRFVDIDWKRLRVHLKRKHGKERATEILKAARRRRSSLRRVTRYLRRQGVLNVHRFYKPLRINKAIKYALDRWSFTFHHEWQLARQKTERGQR